MSWFAGFLGLIVVAALVAIFVGFTIWAMIDAFKRGKTGWGVAILVSWLVGLGWLTAIIYCLGGRSSS